MVLRNETTSTAEGGRGAVADSLRSSVTACPRVASSVAKRVPRRPVEKFVNRRTWSNDSNVAPAVTRQRTARAYPAQSRLSGVLSALAHPQPKIPKKRTSEVSFGGPTAEILLGLLLGGRFGRNELLPLLDRHGTLANTAAQVGQLGTTHGSFALHLDALHAG